MARLLDCKKFWQQAEYLFFNAKEFPKFIADCQAMLPQKILLTYDTKINSILTTDQNYIELIFSPLCSHEFVELVYEIIESQPIILRQIIPAFAFSQAKKTPRSPKIFAEFCHMQSPFFQKKIDAIKLYSNLKLEELVDYIDEVVLLFLVYQILPKKDMTSTKSNLPIDASTSYFEPTDAIKVLTKPLVCCNICGRLSLRVPKSHMKNKSKKYYCTKTCKDLADFSYKAFKGD